MVGTRLFRREMKKELKGGRRGGRVELWAQTAQPARTGGWLGSLRLWVWGYHQQIGLEHPG